MVIGNLLARLFTAFFCGYAVWAFGRNSKGEGRNTMRQFVKSFALLVLVFTLTGCDRGADVPTVRRDSPYAVPATGEAVPWKNRSVPFNDACVAWNFGQLESPGNPDNAVSSSVLISAPGVYWFRLANVKRDWDVSIRVTGDGGPGDTAGSASIAELVLYSSNGKKLKRGWLPPEVSYSVPDRVAWYSQSKYRIYWLKITVSSIAKGNRLYVRCDQHYSSVW
jgi:cbb3-type cytochrome oxidase subunit 3